MFGHRFFGRRYYAARYFADGGVGATPPVNDPGDGGMIVKRRRRRGR